MQINWIKCKERMPPDDDSDIIVSDQGRYYILPSYMINRMRRSAIMNGYEWIPYSDEAWKGLLNKRPP
ncbi:DUF551 domain-containing protein [Nitrosomonas sp. Nm166]|uniref:DUF551 domain-containing protein n=1 Tax=Nitrosomonas sp. Nm166 TaxID=1881054 RepID=UPI000B82C713